MAGEAPMATLTPQADALTDPLLTDQWNVVNAVAAKVTLNLLVAWADYTGRGVRIGVVDDGVDYLHPDLAANDDQTADWDAIGQDDDAYPEWSFQGHGTLVAGVLAAVGENGVGMRGVAHGATMSAFRRGNDESLSGAQLADIFARQGAFDVSNNSWLCTATEFFDALEGGLAPAGAALADAAANGRGGLGTIFVFPSGNNATAGQRADYHGFQSSRWTITVRGIDKSGFVAPFSNPGASVLVSAGAIGVLTTLHPGDEKIARLSVENLSRIEDVWPRRCRADADLPAVEPPAPRSGCLHRSGMTCAHAADRMRRYRGIVRPVARRAALSRFSPYRRLSRAGRAEAPRDVQNRR